MTNGAATLAALGDPQRAAIIEHLARRPMPVNELAALLPISRPAVSQHLKILKDACLVRDKAEGARHIYSIDPAGLDTIRQWLDRHWEQALANFEQTIDKENGK